MSDNSVTKFKTQITVKSFHDYFLVKDTIQKTD